MAEKEWYYWLEREKVGPVSEEKLKSLIDEGTLGNTTIVWSTDMTQPTAARDIRAFRTGVDYGEPGKDTRLVYDYSGTTYHKYDKDGTVLAIGLAFIAMIGWLV